MLNKQIQIYSVNANSFYSDKEKKFLHNEEKVSRRKKWLEIKMQSIEQFTLYSLLKMGFNCPLCNTNKENIKYNLTDFRHLIFSKRLNKDIKKYINKLMKDYKYIIKSKAFKTLLKNNPTYQGCKKKHNKLKKLLDQLIEKYKDVRILNPKKVSKYNMISIFDSYLTRTLNLEYNKLTTDLIIIKIKKYSILKQLIKRGCIFQDDVYSYFTSSAGQIRQQKIVMIKKSLWEQYKNTLMCGLTEEQINNMEFIIDGEKHYGCNINKYLAYLALCNGATDKWKSFDIDKAIVLPDFETKVEGEVDYIEKKLVTEIKKKRNKEVAKINYWEINDKSNRRTMKISITHSDGCGWILPSESSKNFMVRLPWIKGLLTPCDYLTWCKTYNNGNYKVTDIYGKEWDLQKDDIRYVFFKSQFKMSKYYLSWEDYKTKFKDNNCHASKCNVEPDQNKFKNKHVPYQMWQTLLCMQNCEIDYFTKDVVDYLTKAYNQKDFMLDILGANEKKKKKNYLQQALTIYPELIKDPFVQTKLSNKINSKKKEAKSGKFELDNIRYTYLLPDVFAWMEYSLGGRKYPVGLLKNGEVSCKLYKDEPEIIVNRNPHLFVEWGIRNNVVDYRNENWFITNGVYTSCHDLISKLLMFDNDGDLAVVGTDKKLIEIAKRNTEGIVPLHYEMGVAKPQEINSDNIYTSLVSAFKYGNIGEYSNKLTRLWNSNEYDIEMIKVICTINNFSIDAAKTLLMPKIKGDMNKKINDVDKKIKLPYFFRFVKDNYREYDLEKINNSTVNKICKRIEDIPYKKYDYSQFGHFRYDNLLRNKKIEINHIVIKEYKRLNQEMQKYFYKNTSMTKEEISSATWETLKYEFNMCFEENNIKYEDAVDMIVKYVYKNKNERKGRKELLFNVFGDAIVQNLKSNIDTNSILCSKCNKRVKRTSNRQTMCEHCADEVKNERSKISMRNRRQKKKVC
ncbi:hypothetical protein [Desulforamulus aeronauticus]|uniref:Uncharacterized protein n=1 Tax=Desulforamulus aeronauticus DSM 10349 TaxID=1121421 RepID=A0A1M6SBL0_9FIRM|nr:hypothetical protein [Desulforamulus aeronauticus]SHK41907.1 hypothetical protein SAMN02745123_01778 [Desulforamulus aeronauticus DSM 10349]